MCDALPLVPEDAWFQPIVFEADGYVDKPQITLLTGWSKRYGANSGLGDKEAKRLLKNWMGELAIVHARGLVRCLNSRAARCVYETAVRNGKARGHKLPPSLREIDESTRLGIVGWGQAAHTAPTEKSAHTPPGKA